MDPALAVFIFLVLDHTCGAWTLTYFGDRIISFGTYCTLKTAHQRFLPPATSSSPRFLTLSSHAAALTLAFYYLGGAASTIGLFVAFRYVPAPYSAHFASKAITTAHLVIFSILSTAHSAQPLLPQSLGDTVTRLAAVRYVAPRCGPHGSLGNFFQR